LAGRRFGTPPTARPRRVCRSLQRRSPCTIARVGGRLAPVVNGSSPESSGRVRHCKAFELHFSPHPPRREAPRGVCSSAIRCRGPRKIELPKLHSARPRATGRPPTPAEALRRVVPREGLSRGPFWQRVAGPELASRRRAAPRAVCSSAIRWR